MRSIIFTILFSLPFTFASVSHAQATTPADALKAAVDQLSVLGNTPDEAQRTQGLCTLAQQVIDAEAIGVDLLGSYANLASDADGIAAFKALVPTIIVSDFATLLADNLGQKYWVDTTDSIPKGSTRIGYPVYLGSTKLVVTMSKSTSKIVDAEWNNISLVKKKRETYQKTLSRDPNNPKPVTALVNEIVGSGNLLRCN